MYKVVIVDDEPIIVDGLSRVIHWDKFDCRVVGTAFDGREGMEVIDEKKPDIVFLDIAMPEMHGLQMIEALREENPDMMFTVLTGFRDFDVVQTAINLGVCRFLLKPFRLVDIEEAIQFMTDTLDRRNEYGRCGQCDIKKEELCDVRKEEFCKKEPEEETEGKAGNFLVKNTLEYLDTHYAEKLTLSDLADKMYVSQWHLSKLLNGHTKKSFNELLNESRIREAQWLLADFSLRVGDIAEMVGFVDIAHFSRVFKKYTGMSANEYRNRRLG